jgi:hypothetical protein
MAASALATRNPTRVLNLDNRISQMTLSPTAEQPARFNTPNHAPSATFRLPGGKRMTLATDRVRAKPAITPQLSFLLGQNAIGLGLWGLFAPTSVNRFLGLTNSPQMTQVLFGARELATGMRLFSDPTRADALWARIAGDAFDIVLLNRLTSRRNPKRSNAKLALGVVLAVTALDVIAAVRMSAVKRSRV